MKKRVYLSGPITADKEHYKEHFAKIEEYLTNLGFDVTIPLKMSTMMKSMRKVIQTNGQKKLGSTT